MFDLNRCGIDEVLLNRRDWRAELLSAGGLKDLRIAILGGSTTNELVNLLELFLLSSGFKPVFYQADYGRYYEAAVQDPDELIAFKPDVVYIHTSCHDVRSLPPVACDNAQFQQHIDVTLERFVEIWDAIERNVGCQVVQNNFEAPPYAILGNLDTVAYGGKSRFFLSLNVELAQAAMTRAKVSVQDIHGLSAHLGLKNWFDWGRYWGYKLLWTVEANFEVARSLNALIGALYGRSRKVLVLDLDNTLWGGVIGDDGVDRIQIGRETPLAEAYTAFQEYCLSLRERGVLLAVCSKNTESAAKSGFEHPSSVLKLEHCSSFKANWEPKHENILTIAKELNLGVDSFVFVDDNPAERAIVQAQLPQVAVPDVGSDVTHYAEIIEKARYFETVSLSKEDVERAALYAENVQRHDAQAQFANYGEYLDSLEMVAEIDNVHPMYLERIAQLTNKTNQFNLTTRRYTLAQIEEIAKDPGYIAIYGKLRDRFGDNGLISVVVGRRHAYTIHLDLWLMSCRVLKRDMELAMLDVLVERALKHGIRTLCGYYLPTAKNGMVADFYYKLGFEEFAFPGEAAPQDVLAGSSAWKLDLTNYSRRNSHIQLLETINA